MAKSIKSEVERYRELERQGSATQKDWEALSQGARKKLLRDIGEVPDPNREAYIQYMDYSPVWVCSKCGYEVLDTWEEVVYLKGDSECEHELRLSAVLHRIPLDFNEKGKVPGEVIKKAMQATEELLKHHVISSMREGSRPGKQPSYSILNNRLARRAITELYKHFKGLLASNPKSEELTRHVSLYDPALLKRVVRLNAQDDIEDEIKPLFSPKHMEYAWCLAVSEVARQNPNITNVPGVATVERGSYPSRL